MTVRTRSLAIVLPALLAAAPYASAAIVDVAVAPGGSFTFQPSDVVVDLGDTVRWTWMDGDHNVVSGPAGVANGYFDSGEPAGAGTMFEVVFDQAFLDANPEAGNVYDYHCEPHAVFGMVGSVTVKPGEVPTVSEWGLIILASLLVIGAAVVMRQRRTTAHVG